jgi:hypothetical protein
LPGLDNLQPPQPEAKPAAEPAAFKKQFSGKAGRPGYWRGLKKILAEMHPRPAGPTGVLSGSLLQIIFSIILLICRLKVNLLSYKDKFALGMNS